MNEYACPRCTQDLCSDCFDLALASISTHIIPVSRKPIDNKITTDDYLERRRAPGISRDHYKYGGMGLY